MPASEPHSDATQRVRIPQDGSAHFEPPVRRTPSRTNGQGTSPNRRPPQRKRKRSANKNRNLVLILSGVIAVLLIAIVITCVSMFSAPKDDGLILQNVYVAGVDLSGMTEEEAVQAVRLSVGNTYSKTDMVITVVEEQYVLSPADTKASLNVEAAVHAAYQYGRTGTRAQQNKAKQEAMSTGYHVPLGDYLNLDAAYINGVIKSIGDKYSSILRQPEITVSGERPDTDMEHPDTTVVHQTLTIRKGTREYGLNPELLAKELLDSYSKRVFAFTATCPVVEPREPDVDALYEEYCLEPIDADQDENFETIPEVYGYGFDLETVKQQVAQAGYGEVLEIPLCFIRPNFTAEDLSGDLFKDVLGHGISRLPEDPDALANLKKAVSELNNKKIKAGEVFSFNNLIGEPTVRKGYKKAFANVGREFVEIYGGGISQLSSALYVSALLADLPIMERYTHYYVPSFTDPGLDADVQYGSRDLKFTNNTEHPIRIEAVITDNSLSITFWGTETRDYSVRISYEVVNTYSPTLLFQTISKDNPAGYADGDTLVESIIGYDIITYKTYIYDDPEIEPEEEIEAGESHYEKRNPVIAQIEEEPEPTVPTTPPTSSISDTTGPDSDDPTQPTTPGTSTTLPTVPSESTTQPTVPDASTTQPTVPDTSSTQPTVPDGELSDN